MGVRRINRNFNPFRGKQAPGKVVSADFPYAGTYVEHETATRERPAWMVDTALLPKRPPGKP